MLIKKEFLEKEDELAGARGIEPLTSVLETDVIPFN